VARIVLFVVMGATGVLLLWMGRAAATGRLKRNMYAGIRTSSLLASDEAWLAGHRRAEPSVRVAGGISIAVALSTLLPLSENAQFAVVMVGAVLVLGAVLYGAAVAGRAARELNER